MCLFGQLNEEKYMCLAIPMEIVKIEGDTAVCTVNDVSVNVSVSLVPHAKVGDWAIVHAGFAIEILDENEARKTLELFDELEQAYKESITDFTPPSEN